MRTYVRKVSSHIVTRLVDEVWSLLMFQREMMMGLLLLMTLCVVWLVLL
jgi:hypothetical protein